jgi:hypothetical protein
MSGEDFITVADAIANCTLNTETGSAGMMCSCGHHRRLYGEEALDAFQEFVKAEPPAATSTTKESAQ